MDTYFYKDFWVNSDQNMQWIFGIRALLMCCSSPQGISKNTSGSLWLAVLEVYIKYINLMGFRMKCNVSLKSEVPLTNLENSSGSSQA